MAVDGIGNHLSYLCGADPFFGPAWDGLSSELRSHYVCTLRDIESMSTIIEATGHGIEELHEGASTRARRHLRHLSETPFPVPPAPEEWIRLAHDRTRLEALYRVCEEWLKRLIEEYGRPGIRCYGGVKPEASIKAKIMEHEVAGTALDLWDLVRLRIVLPSLGELLAFAAYLLKQAKGLLARLRNYYLRPRPHPCATYRALHFELSSDYRSFVEVQLMTARRDAVCLIDHALVLKGSAEFGGPQHRVWLEKMSRCANLLDFYQFVALSHPVELRTLRLAG